MRDVGDPSRNILTTAAGSGPSRKTEFIKEPGPFPTQVSGCTPNTNEVKAMKKAFERRGEPIVLYEFLQGMVDYGRGREPAPRLTLELKNGDRITYEGQPVQISADNPVVAMEFTNAGPGLAPENVVIFEHVGADDTLGMHGRGLTIALTYLASEGMAATVSSNYKNNSWSGATKLATTESGLSEVLTMDGKWQGKISEEEASTTIRIENPTAALVEQISDLPNFFLYANPRYPSDALVGPAAKEQAEPYQISIGEKGKVACLDKIVNAEPAEESQGYNFVYVDGLKLPFRSINQATVLPWAVEGLRD